MPTLKNTLRGMLANAREIEGRAIRRTLTEGIILEVIQAPGGNVSLTLERADTAPTPEEWQAVIAQWPELGPANVVPTPRKEGKRHALVGRWPRPAGITETAG